MECRALVDWFADRLLAEKAVRENTRDNDTIPTEDEPFDCADTISDFEVYKCTHFTKRRDPGQQQFEENEVHEELVEDGDIPSQDAQEYVDEKFEKIIQQQSLVFDSEFECGNLQSATRVLGRESLLPGRRDSPSSGGERATPPASDFHELAVNQEYDLILSNDMFTTGNIQWYYFSVSSPPALLPHQMRSIASLPDEHCISYPLTVRFNVTNMMKTDALYNYGCLPAIYSTRAAEFRNIGWTHGGCDVCYYKNDKSFLKKHKERVKRQHHYTLSFTYTFGEPDTVYFAHCFPYTYTRLQNYLLTLERDPRISSFIRRKLLCCSLANNRCDLLTITAPSQNPSEMENRPGLVLTARVHPGESNSSFVMEGLLDFLTSENPEAVKLRETYVIKVVPMLNPDGVIHGNYRCSLAGCDLNRKYMNTDPQLHPTIYAVKELISSMSKGRGVSLYLDIHGHSQRKNVFLYGCDPNQTNVDKIISAVQTLSPAEGLDRSVFSRIFPKILVSTSSTLAKNQGTERGYFSFEDSALGIQKSKVGTGRVVTWRNAGVSAAYTVEISFCANGDNMEVKLIKTLATQYKRKHTREQKLNGTLNCYRDYLDDLGNSTKWSAELTRIMHSYSTTAHYTEEDLLSMGSEICLAIYSYSNLDVKQCKGLREYIIRNIGGGQPPRPASAAAGLQPRPFSRRTTDAATEKILEERNAVRAVLLNQDKNRNALTGIQEITMAVEITEPILHPAIMSAEILEQLVGKQGPSRVYVPQFSPRLLCEIELRKAYKLNTSGPSQDIPLDKKGDNTAQEKPDEESIDIGDCKQGMDETLEDSVDALFDDFNGSKLLLYNIDEDMGSDSDPSGDEAATAILAKSAAFIHLARFSKHDLARKIKLARKRSRAKKSKLSSGSVGGDTFSSTSSYQRRKSSMTSKVPENAPPKNVKSRYRSASLAPHRQAIAESVALNRVAMQQQTQQQLLLQQTGGKKLPPTIPVKQAAVKIRNFCLDPEASPKQSNRSQQTLSAGGNHQKALISSSAVPSMSKNHLSNMPQSASTTSLLRLSVTSSSSPPLTRDSKKGIGVMSHSASDGDLPSSGHFKRYIPASHEHIVVRQNHHAGASNYQQTYAVRNVVTVGDMDQPMAAAPGLGTPGGVGDQSICASPIIGVGTREKYIKPAAATSSPSLCGLDSRVVSRASPPLPVFESPKRRAFLNGST